MQQAWQCRVLTKQAHMQSRLPTAALTLGTGVGTSCLLPWPCLVTLSHTCTSALPQLLCGATVLFRSGLGAKLSTDLPLALLSELTVEQGIGRGIYAHLGESHAKSIPGIPRGTSAANKTVMTFPVSTISSHYLLIIRATGMQVTLRGRGRLACSQNTSSRDLG